ncbi:DNA cytosine methyltransferase [Streptomyces sp. RLB3-6]|uniref:DNA cytosine methyltransferase n=1 Tax=Streptomyces sp. RLB3-6 TaxID=2594457 RepID=UPI001163F637|nr:DNA cytosine methyltransferase [Streptomyces sp. RLB3-6]QDN84383.1 DNA cytosine methyltransferase [Streptomyces sp. RLB3-6]
MIDTNAGECIPSPEWLADDDVEDPAVILAAAGHPDLIECQRTADLLAAYAESRPDSEAQGWAFNAERRVAQCAYAVVEGNDEEAARFGRQAKDWRAEMTIDRLESEGQVTAEQLVVLDRATYELLQWYAAPWPVEWLFPPAKDGRGRPVRPRIVVLFAGPGGLTHGILRILRANVDVIGVDLDGGAVATSTAAGYRVIHADVTALDPEHPALQFVTGVAVTPPCQPFNPSGLRKGHYESAITLIEDTITEVAAAAGFFPWQDARTGYAPRLKMTWDEVREPLAQLEDVRAGLMAEVILWPLAMLARGGSVEWVAVEQSSALPARIETALTDRLTEAGWHTTEAWTLDAVDYGSASHRKRRLMAAYRGESPFVDLRPASPFPVTTFAECVGWPAGREYLTRGNRPIDPETGRAKGGSARSADLPSTCVTATAYGWADSETGEKIDQPNIGRLVGFPGDYPWRHVGRGRGVRNVAQQAADVVSPMVSAALFGRILGDPNWEAKTRAYVHALYGTESADEGGQQLLRALFGPLIPPQNTGRVTAA